MPGEGLDDSAKAIVFDSLVNLGLRPTTQKVQIKVQINLPRPLQLISLNLVTNPNKAVLLHLITSIPSQIKLN
jgi:hypothetical protein